MELDLIFKNRRSCRSYLSTPVSRSNLVALIGAAQQAPVSCNLQLTQYVVIDDQQILEDLAKIVSYKFTYAPACIVVLYDPRFTAKRHSVVSSAAMAAEHILLKAVDLGLAACPMAGFSKDDLIKDRLAIPDDLEILMIIAVGYPNQSTLILPPNRLPLDEIYSFNQYGHLPRLSGSRRLIDYQPREIIDYRRRIASVYLDRFRLHTWSADYYSQALDYLTNYLRQSQLTGRLLDVMSYDGIFINKLLESKLRNDFTITASDYLSENLTFLNKQLGCQTMVIDDNNQIGRPADNLKFDVATLIFQAEFTPQLSDLLKSVNSRLESGGVVFIATVDEVWWRRLMRWLRSIGQIIIGRPSNIYEGNPFYKIGPRRHLGHNDILRLAQGFSWNLIQYDLVPVRRGVRLGFYLALIK